MHVLVTGGAGFIGSHLIDRLLAAGHDVRVLDSLDPQVHNGWPDYLAADVERIEGDVRDRDAVKGALEGVDRLVHLAAAVGVGQSMYEIERYTSVNAMGAAVVLEAAIDVRAELEKVVVASSMSIYGEGLYRCPAEDVAAHARAPFRRAACPEGVGARLSLLRNGARAGGDAGVEAAPAALDLRGRQARPRGDVPRLGPRLQGADDGAPLLQRVRPAPGPLQPLHRRGRDLRFAAAERSAARRLRGWPPEP